MTGLGRGTRARLPAGAMLELNGGYDESPADDSDGPAAGRQRRAENRAGLCLPVPCEPSGRLSWRSQPVAGWQPISWLSSYMRHLLAFGQDLVETEPGACAVL